jgi:hypothetical protein
VCFASDAPPAAAGLSGHPGEEEDPFLTSTPVQPPNQVSIYFINFLYMYLTNLIKGHFHSPPSETFNLHNVSDGSQEDGADVTVAPDPGSAIPSHCQRRKKARQAGKAGSRQGKKLPADLQCGFDDEKDGKRVCKCCLSVFFFFF